MNDVPDSMAGQEFHNDNPIAVHARGPLGRRV